MIDFVKGLLTAIIFVVVLRLAIEVLFNVAGI